jgi:hypothetical protein
MSSLTVTDLYGDGVNIAARIKALADAAAALWRELVLRVREEWRPSSNFARDTNHLSSTSKTF